jgi:hypothetical protein
MTDRHLQQDFQGKIFNIDGIKRECYYCTLEDGGAWIWLRPNDDNDDTDCDKINFVVKSKYDLDSLFKQVRNNEFINSEDYGYLDFQ